MIDPSKVFTEEQKTAIDILLAAGFVALADTKIRDTRELGTKLRRRTFRHRRRYAMVLALRDAPPEVAEDGTDEAPYEIEAPLKYLDDMTKPELLEEVKRRDWIEIPSGLTKAEILDVLQFDNERRDLLHRRFDAA